MVQAARELARGLGVLAVFGLVVFALPAAVLGATAAGVAFLASMLIVIPLALLDEVSRQGHRDQPRHMPPHPKWGHGICGAGSDAAPATAHRRHVCIVRSVGPARTSLPALRRGSLTALRVLTRPQA